jgi:hypothetical protein
LNKNNQKKSTAKKSGGHFLESPARRIIAPPPRLVTEPKIFRAWLARQFLTHYENLKISLLIYIYKNFKAFHSFSDI